MSSATASPVNETTNPRPNRSLHSAAMSVATAAKTVFTTHADSETSNHPTSPEWMSLHCRNRRTIRMPRVIRPYVTRGVASSRRPSTHAAAPRTSHARSWSFPLKCSAIEAMISAADWNASEVASAARTLSIRPRSRSKVGASRQAISPHAIASTSGGIACQSASTRRTTTIVQIADQTVADSDTDGAGTLASHLNTRSSSSKPRTLVGSDLRRSSTLSTSSA